MSEPLDEAYLAWLYSQVGTVYQKQPGRNYWSLMRQLFHKEFTWTVPRDENRSEDGRYLRYEFINETGAHVTAEWMGVGCSMLELLIGLARRLAFEGEGEARVWFWEMVNNIGVAVNDRHYNDREARLIDERLDLVIHRRYSRDGVGGLFPLTHRDRDQRKVEIWYQLNAYLMELD